MLAQLHQEADFTLFTPTDANLRTVPDALNFPVHYLLVMRLHLLVHLNDLIQLRLFLVSFV